jgi:hypothetical protein
MKPSIAFVLACATLMTACASDKIEGTAAKNQPPTIWIAAAPPEGSTSIYTVQLFWGGWDPDGEISYYEYLITDNKSQTFNPADTVGVTWSPVVSNDSTFTFSADSLAETVPGQLPAVFKRSHTFFIRSVDREGLRSVEPAYRSFTARTLSPDINITTPRQALGLTPSELPPIATYEWVAVDYVDDMITRQDPDSVQWALEHVQARRQFTDTIDYLRSRSSSASWYPWSLLSRARGQREVLDHAADGIRRLRVRHARQRRGRGGDAGARRTPQRAPHQSIAPHHGTASLVVTSQFVGSVVASTCDYPLTILDMVAGVGMSFTLSACADDYGGTVSGYRYGWDILDLNDPDQWETDYTPFVGSLAVVPPRSFNFGTHTFTAEVIDNSGFCSRVEVKVNIVRFSGERNLLLVDDYGADEDAGFSGFN